VEETQVPDLISRTKRELQERIAQLEEAVEELPKLKRALEALSDDAPASSAAGHRSRGSSPSSRPDGRSRGRRRPRGANRDAILTVVRERPGVSVGEVANVVAREGVKKNVVYTTVNKLVKDGRITKTDGALEVATGGEGGDGAAA
jgi:hypothetical protein